MKALSIWLVIPFVALHSWETSTAPAATLRTPESPAVASNPETRALSAREQKVLEDFLRRARP